MVHIGCSISNFPILSANNTNNNNNNNNNKIKSSNLVNGYIQPIHNFDEKQV